MLALTFATIAALTSVKAQIVTAAQKYGQDPVELLAIAAIESSYNPRAIGALGEIGLFQLRPQFYNIKLGDSIEKQVKEAGKLLTEVKFKCKNKYIQCWNMGITKTKKLKLKVTAYERKFQNAKSKIVHDRRGLPSSKSKTYYAAVVK